MSSEAARGPRVYLDHNATAPLRPDARAAMVAALDHCGNASSVHAEGRDARALVEEARRHVADLLGRPPQDVVLVSGGTEAANFAVSGAFRRSADDPQGALIVGAGEHACVIQGHGYPADAVEAAPLGRDGALDLGALDRALVRRAGAPVALALQAANNETGVIQPLEEASRLTRAHGGLVICDAVQALGRIELDPAVRDADVLFVSAHKIGGPKGVGALAFDPARLHIERGFVRGGGQERSFRGGTENAAAIAGFGAACVEAARSLASESRRLADLRDALEAEVRRIALQACFFGAESRRLPNTSAFAVPGVSAETLVIALDLAGVAVSSGSACSSGKVGRSHVLAGMGVPPDLARGALRISMGWSTVESDVAVFCEALEKTLRSIASRRVGRAA